MAKVYKPRYHGGVRVCPRRLTQYAMRVAERWCVRAAQEFVERCWNMSATGISILFRTMYVFVQHYWNLL